MPVGVKYRFGIFSDSIIGSFCRQYHSILIFDLAHAPLTLFCYACNPWSYVRMSVNACAAWIVNFASIGNPWCRRKVPGCSGVWPREDFPRFYCNNWQGETVLGWASINIWRFPSLLLPVVLNAWQDKSSKLVSFVVFLSYSNLILMCLFFMAMAYEHNAAGPCVLIFRRIFSSLTTSSIFRFYDYNLYSIFTSTKKTLVTFRLGKYRIYLKMRYIKGYSL